MKQFSNAWSITKQTFNDFLDEKVLKLSAALAFYTILALPGLMIIILWLSESFMGENAVEGRVYSQISEMLGRDAAVQIQQTIGNATSAYDSGFAAIVGIITLVFGATSMFSEIQDSINSIWRLKAKPKKGWLKFLVNRLLSFSVIVTLGFLLMVSLVINAVMDVFLNKLVAIFPETQFFLVYGFNMLLTFLITSVLFALIFKVLPDAKISWKNVRAGAFATAVLFLIGNVGIGYYLGQNKLSTAYGAAGSVIIILMWVYYSAAILYFGAIFTRSYALHTGSNIYPNQYAVWVEQVEVDADKGLQETVLKGHSSEEH